VTLKGSYLRLTDLVRRDVEALDGAGVRLEDVVADEEELLRQVEALKREFIDYKTIMTTYYDSLRGFGGNSGLKFSHA